MKFSPGILLLVLHLFSFDSEASSNAGNMGNVLPCPSIKTSKDAINCVMQNHPAIKRAQAQLEQSEAGVDRASQRINPDLDGKWLVGESLGDVTTSAEASLLYTLELGGKRSSRMDLATAQAQVQKAESTRAKETAFLEGIKAVYHARQIRDELRTLEEIISTFRQVLNQYRKLPRLNPEQQVSSGVLSLAESDYVIKQAQLQTEWEEVIKSLEIMTAGSLGSGFSAFPEFRTTWPKIGPMPDDFALKGAEIELAQANVEAGKNEYELAKSESFPDLKIGPIATYENQGGVSSASIGVNFSIPLQVLSWNGGGRAVGLKSFASAEVNQSLRTKELRAELNTLIKKYEKATSIIAAQPTQKQIEKMHREAEGHFGRGVVSSALLIEAHRQLFELLRDKNEYELEALETLIRIKILKGEPLEAIQ